MKRRARLILAITLLCAGVALAGIRSDEGPGHIPLREIPRLWVRGLRPHPQSGRSVAPTTPVVPAAPAGLTVSLDLSGVHLGLPESAGPALGFTWDGALQPWVRLD